MTLAALLSLLGYLFGEAGGRVRAGALPYHLMQTRRHASAALSSAMSWKPSFWETGAGEGIRTLDPNLGKVVLYP